MSAARHNANPSGEATEQVPTRRRPPAGRGHFRRRRCRPSRALRRRRPLAEGPLALVNRSRREHARTRRGMGASNCQNASIIADPQPSRFEYDASIFDFGHLDISKFSRRSGPSSTSCAIKSQASSSLLEGFAGGILASSPCPTSTSAASSPARSQTLGQKNIVTGRNCGDLVLEGEP